MTPAGVAIFGLKQDGVLVTETSITATEPVLDGRIFVEVNGPVSTGLAIANPNDVDATVNFFFTDLSGVDYGSGTLTIGANEQTAKFLNEAPFSEGDSEIVGTLTFASSVPVSVMALRSLTNGRAEFISTTLPIVPLTASASDVMFIPLFAVGGGWTTDVILVNPTNTTITGQVEFFGQGSVETPANSLSITLRNESPRSSFDYSIPARSTRRLTTSSPSAVSVGSVRATADPGSSIPAGLGILSLAAGGVTVAATGVQALPPGRAFSVYVEVEAAGAPGRAGSIRSGLAIMDASGSRTP